MTTVNTSVTTPSPALALASAAPKKSPWGNIKKSTAAVSLSDIQREEQSRADASLAARMQYVEKGFIGSPTTHEQRETASYVSAVAPSDPVEGTLDDEQLALLLQQEELAAAGHAADAGVYASLIPGIAPQAHSAPTAPATAPVASDATALSDEALAAALQAEFDAEHERAVSAMERRANLFTNRYLGRFHEICNPFSLYKEGCARGHCFHRVER